MTRRAVRRLLVLLPALILTTCNMPHINVPHF
jgi:hypothetical protein